MYTTHLQKNIRLKKTIFIVTSTICLMKRSIVILGAYYAHVLQKLSNSYVHPSPQYPQLSAIVLPFESTLVEHQRPPSESTLVH